MVEVVERVIPVLGDDLSVLPPSVQVFEGVAGPTSDTGETGGDQDGPPI